MSKTPDKDISNDDDDDDEKIYLTGCACARNARLGPDAGELSPFVCNLLLLLLHALQARQDDAPSHHPVTINIIIIIIIPGSSAVYLSANRRYTPSILTSATNTPKAATGISLTPIVARGWKSADLTAATTKPCTALTSLPPPKQISRLHLQHFPSPHLPYCPPSLSLSRSLSAADTLHHRQHPTTTTLGLRLYCLRQ